MASQSIQNVLSNTFASGYSGYSGQLGISGYSGYSGFSGYSGRSGYSGLSGYSSFSGYSGTDGISGYSGISGFSGYSGKSGYSGFSGISGYSGLVGTSGFSGYSGSVGASGYSGANGASGYSGVSGFSGTSGYSGAQGTSGFSGYSGGIGTSGYSGVQGISGYSGATGASGYSGVVGTSGFSGYSGTVGLSGFSGYSGALGVSGYSGTSGYSGYSGRSGYSGSPALNWSVVTTTTTAVANGQYLANTSGGTFTLNLPATPTTGNTVVVAAGSNLSATPVTIGRNGSTIGGVADDVLIDYSNLTVWFVFDGTTWQVSASTGPMGTSGYSGVSFTSITGNYISVTGTGAQTISTANTKVTSILNTVVTDPNSWWDNTNKKFLPLRAGNYLVCGALQSNSGSAALQLLIYKNSSSVVAGSYQAPGAAVVSTISGVVSLNGTTDFVELYAYQSTSASVGGLAQNNYLNFTYLGPQ